MIPNEIRISFTIRPKVWFRNMGILAGFMAAIFLPLSKMDAGVPPPTPEQLAYANATEQVSVVLKARMPKMPETKRTTLASTIVRESVRAGFDPLFILSIIDAESGFNLNTPSIRCRVPGVESTCYANARGLMQIIPSTWNAEIKRRNLHLTDIDDPVQNVIVGIGYLEHLAKGRDNKGGFKRMESLLSAYNQGSGFAKAGDNIPEGWTQEKFEKAQREAQGFISSVQSSYKKLLNACYFTSPFKVMRTIYKAPNLTVFNANVVCNNFPPPVAKAKVPGNAVALR